MYYLDATVTLNNTMEEDLNIYIAHQVWSTWKESLSIKSHAHKTEDMTQYVHSYAL